MVQWWLWDYWPLSGYGRDLLQRREFLVCYCDPVQKLMAGDVLGPRVEPTTVTLLNGYSVKLAFPYVIFFFYWFSGDFTSYTPITFTSQFFPDHVSPPPCDLPFSTYTQQSNSCYLYAHWGVRKLSLACSLNRAEWISHIPAGRHVLGRWTPQHSITGFKSFYGFLFRLLLVG